MPVGFDLTALFSSRSNKAGDWPANPTLLPFPASTPPLFASELLPVRSLVGALPEARLLRAPLLHPRGRTPLALPTPSPSQVFPLSLSPLGQLLDPAASAALAPAAGQWLGLCSGLGGSTGHEAGGARSGVGDGGLPPLPTPPRPRCGGLPLLPRRLLDPGAVDLNLLPGRKKAADVRGFAATYGRALCDGTPVAVKRLGKTCCRQEEAQFLRGLKLLAELRHDNVVPLRGFCCSRARGECYLVYNLVPNGSLSQFLDVAERSSVRFGEKATLRKKTVMDVKQEDSAQLTFDATVFFHAYCAVR
ncbi:hypothetical protein EJB05_45250, partial [Eragrostis curvula]